MDSAAATSPGWAPALGEMAFRQSPTPLLVLAVERRGDTMVPGPVLECSESFVQLIGAPRHELVGMPLQEFIHPDDQMVLESGVARLLDPSRQSQVRIVRPGWGVVWVALSATHVPDEGTDGLLVAALDDITAFRKAEQALAHRASHDPLTGLPNRAVLLSHLGRVVARLGRHPGTVAVMFVDLDGFKNINDSYGHRLGDAVLKEVARRVALAVRRDDVVTRMGGDEFVVVCDALDPSESATVAERIRAALDEPFEIQGRLHGVSASVGVAQTSDPATTPEDLLRRADLAMYQAKDRGRNRVEFFAASLEQRVRGRVRMVETLRAALDEDRIGIAVQPVFRLSDTKLVGHEALARLHLADGTVTAAEGFLPEAQQSGVVVRLDNRVMAQALVWLRGAAGSTWLSVNVSARLLANARFLDNLTDLASASGIPPRRLAVEISEESLGGPAGPAILTLRRLRAAGFAAALDDFGSGLSSLTAIRDLPVDYVKVDRSLVAGIGSSPADESIVSAVITVAHDLGVQVVAEGIETPNQADFLRERGCDLGQGHLLGSPQLVRSRP